jgi:hypothetical protein
MKKLFAISLSIVATVISPACPAFAGSKADTAYRLCYGRNDFHSCQGAVLDELEEEQRREQNKIFNPYTRHRNNNSLSDSYEDLAVRNYLRRRIQHRQNCFENRHGQVFCQVR